jgi:hypothetical protein
MCGIRDEFLTLVVHHQVQNLQWYLAQKIGHRLGNFDNVEVLLSAHQFKLHGLVLQTHCFPVGSL